MPGKTPNFLPYPTGTDFVVDGDNAIRALAESLRLWHTSFQLAAPTGNAVFKEQAIVFPVGLYSQPPAVFCAGNNNTSGTGIIVAPIESTRTATGVTIRAVLTNGQTWGSSYWVHVFAIQLPTS